MQIFQEGRLLFSSLKQAKLNGTKVPEFYSSDGSFSFEVNCVLSGDVLLRCRHIETTTGKRISMFRAGFHTGYILELVQRLPRSQCDGAAADERFEQDFFVDLIFAPVNEAEGGGRESQKGRKRQNLVGSFGGRLRSGRNASRRAKQAALKDGNHGKNTNSSSKMATTVDLQLPASAKKRTTDEREDLEGGASSAGETAAGSPPGDVAASPVRATDLFAASTAVAPAPAATPSKVTTSTTQKTDVFSLADEDEEDEDVVFEALNADKSGETDTLSAAQQRQQAEANRSVAELAKLEAELGLVGEDFAVSPQLKMLGKDVASDAPAAANSVTSEKETSKRVMIRLRRRLAARSNWMIWVLNLMTSII